MRIKKKLVKLDGSKYLAGHQNVSISSGMKSAFKPFYRLFKFGTHLDLLKGDPKTVHVAATYI